VYDQAVRLPGPLAVRGIASTHPETHDKYDGPHLVVPVDGLSAGAVLLQRDIGFQAKTAIIDNLSNYTIRLDGASRVIPAGMVGAVLPLFPTLNQYALVVVSGNNSAAGALYVTMTERIVPSASSLVQSVGAASNTNATIVGPLDGAGGVKVGLDAAIPAGANLIGSVGITGALPAGASLIGRVIAQGTAGDAQQDSSGDFFTAERAAPSTAIAQVATSTVAATAAVGRITRRYVYFRNLDATNSIWVGPATVTSANGALLKPGESRYFYGQILYQAIAGAGTPSLEVEDVWY
jgi:hypothetical protein